MEKLTDLSLKQLRTEIYCGTNHGLIMRKQQLLAGFISKTIKMIHVVNNSK